MKISLALLMLISSLFAQSMDREKMSDKRAEMLQDKKVFMIGAMTKDLDLSSEQAEKFFPLHNAFQKKSQDVKELHSKNLRKLREAARNDRSKFDVDAAINSKLKMQGALARLESKFLKDTKGILSEDQRIKLLFFEERMKSKMMDDRNSNKRNFDSKKKRN